MHTPLVRKPLPWSHALQELEEARRLAASQKRALREAAMLAAEREAAERAATEASQAVVTQVVEDEMERLLAELAALRVSE